AITFPHPREEDRLVIAREGSVIAQLVGLAEHSLEGYPISPEMGAWFILTGMFEAQDPVRMRYLTYERSEFSRATLTLEVESWVPPEEVLKQYRHAQNELLGKRPRSLKGRTLAVFEFVNRNKGGNWSELFETWNKQHPRWRFKDPRHLNTVYTRAVEYVAGVKLAKTKEQEQPKIVGTDRCGSPILADKWYLLHPREEGKEGDSYTGTFESREEAQGDPRSENSEVLTAKKLVDELTKRARNN
ncbi:MAG: hypothetical protein K0S10_1313, partial [Rubrobacteraceae bacterium]|nr:hypothetical protein [Rubrobacteraceae bacterium]